MEPAGKIEAVLCDLDDTLFAQHDWLHGAWSAVAAAAELQGVEPRSFVAELRRIAAEGSARGGIIDRALASVGAEVPTDVLVKAFHAHRPRTLSTYPGIRESLAALKSAGIALALVTDGDVGVQTGKLAALELSGEFAIVVLSDCFGREFRKPHPAPFQAALTRLGVAPENAVFIGDRPDKDVKGAAGVGLRAVRVRTGEYSEVPDLPETWLTAATFAEAVRVLLEMRGGY